MEKNIYKIKMHTTIGKRYGKMIIQKTGNIIHGEMEVLQHKEPLEGMVDSDGKLQMKGKIVTLIKSFQYTAVGWMTPDEIKLKFMSDYGEFAITGGPLEGQGGKDGEVL